MNKKFILAGLLSFVATCVSAQSNYLDQYIGHAVTATVLGTSANQLNHPTDLDFKPNSNELWVCNYGDANGGSMVLFYNTGLPNQTSEYRMDSHSGHFMIYPNAMAFGDDGKWAAVSEIQNTASPTSTFMGPALWLGDTSIFARVFQNPWLNGYPLGSHVDMLHQSPFAMGIAHDSAMIYWVMDGYNGNICKYNFVQDHGPGYDDHSAGKIWRYIDVPVSRVPQVPSHMVVDKANGWLYFIDGAGKKVKRMNTHSGSVTGTLTVPSTAPEALAGYWKVEGATVEALDSVNVQPCGIDYYNGRLLVSDFGTGDIYLYSTTGIVTLLDRIVTGHPGMMGVKVGPDGHIWCVNKTENILYRLDVARPALDACIGSITSPDVENYGPNYFSTAFDNCDPSVMPVIEIANKGDSTITAMQIGYTIDGGSPVVYSWLGSLATDSSVSVTLPSSPLTGGAHHLTAMITSVNGVADDVDLNNVMSGSFRSFNAPVLLPFSEGFSSPSFPAAGWSYIHFNPNNKMSQAAAGGFGHTTGSMKMDNFSNNTDITGQKDYLMLPILDMTPTLNPSLTFSVAHARYSSSSNDALNVSVSVDCGSTWVSVYNKSGATLSTAPVTTSAFTPSSSQWRSDTVSLSTYSGEPEVMIMFTSTSNFGNNFYVDDVLVNELVTGVHEMSFENGLSVFPNPATSAIELIFSGNSGREMTGTVFSSEGRLVKSFTIPAAQKQVHLDVSDLAVGVYGIRLTDDQTVITKTIVKQ